MYFYYFNLETCTDGAGSASNYMYAVLTRAVKTSGN